MSAVVSQPDRRTFLVQGGSRAVVNEIQLFAEVVEGETHNIEEVSVDVLHQHPTESLDTVASSLVPDTHRHFTYTAILHKNTLVICVILLLLKMQNKLNNTLSLTQDRIFLFCLHIPHQIGQSKHSQNRHQSPDSNRFMNPPYWPPLSECLVTLLHQEKSITITYVKVQTVILTWVRRY